MKKFCSFSLLMILIVIGACKENTKETITTATITPQEKYVNEHPELRDEVKKNIIEGIVTIGMTEEQVRASWGNPDDIEIFTSEYNSYKRWVYKNRPKVYMKDGKVNQLQK